MWVSDLILRRTALMDADSGRFLGMISGGYGTVMPLVPRTRPEVYLPASHCSRGTHGPADVVEVYDVATRKEHSARWWVPAKRATNAVALAHAALSDDDRFLALFNWTTGTSLTIVDVVDAGSSARSRRRGAAWSTPTARAAFCRCAPTGPCS
ncbi:MAG: hypothetical protein U0802_24070 [Candidatus Binatia bacterium]